MTRFPTLWAKGRQWMFWGDFNKAFDTPNVQHTALQACQQLADRLNSKTHQIKWGYIRLVASY